MLKVYIKTAHYKSIAQPKKKKKNNLIQKRSLTQQIQHNYYLSVASVDSSTTELTCIFPKTLNKRINACVENTSKT